MNYSSYTDRDDDDRPSLSLGERVVWISDGGPEYGNVRWLGKLNDLGTEWMAGVEFDNPVGSGTGLYKDEQLFLTRLNHASLVPVIGLLKASDFNEPPPLPDRTSSAKLIDFNQQLDQKPANRSPGQYSQAENYKIKPSDSCTRSRNQSHPGNMQFDHMDDPVHYIPIRVEDEQETSKLKHNRVLHPTKKPTLPAKPARTSQEKLIYDCQSVDDLTSNLASTGLNSQKVDDLSPLPAPSMVVSASEKNVNSVLKKHLGKSRGIQGHNNSCYLDATLFAMFSSTTLFDSLLYRPQNERDIPEYREIQRILREELVKPLRENYFVSADRVMLFRTMLERSSSVAGLTDEEKDPEEFLSLLLGQILKAEPYLKLSSGLESFFYQLIVDKDESVVLPTVQDLFEQSFMNSTVRLREIPPCLLLQMPRFGSQYKMYSRIMPSLKLDITDVLGSVPRSCGHRAKDCDNLARIECKDCFGERTGSHNARLSAITYCNNCFQSKHFGKSYSTGIEDHDKTKTLLENIPIESVSRFSNKISQVKDREIPRVCMDLFAVLCIETSHYVCFVKCGQDTDAPWCFFDSMADRKGEQNGYNIPEVIMFDEFQFWTSERGISQLLNLKDERNLPEMARRLICDAYLCFYQYSGLISYR